MFKLFLFNLCSLYGQSPEPKNVCHPLNSGLFTAMLFLFSALNAYTMYLLVWATDLANRSSPGVADVFLIFSFLNVHLLLRMIFLSFYPSHFKIVARRTIDSCVPSFFVLEGPSF